MTLKTLSYSATSMTCPRPPLTSRWRSASSTPMTPCSAASVSPMLTPTRTGTRPGSPVRWRRPPMASPSTPKPGLFAEGPVWPKPLMRSTMSPGLASRSASGERPQPSSVPGLKLSKRLRAYSKMGLKEAKEVIDAAAQAGYDKPVSAVASASDLVKPGRAPGEVPASRSRLVL
jgi:hypothetical protein